MSRSLIFMLKVPSIDIVVLALISPMILNRSAAANPLLSIIKVYLNNDLNREIIVIRLFDYHPTADYLYLIHLGVSVF